MAMAIGYTYGGNTTNFLNCITQGQTNEVLQLAPTGTHNFYSFDSSGNRLAASWQTQSIQSFTGVGQKYVGCYNTYSNCVCTGGVTVQNYFISPRIDASFVSDNGNTCTIQIKTITDQFLSTTSTIALYQEINGVWTQLVITGTIPANTQSYNAGYHPTANVTIPSSQSNTPLHFKVSSVWGGSGGVETWADMWLECAYIGNPALPPTPAPQVFVDFGKAYCKEVQLKCVGNFAAAEEAGEDVDNKLIEILATNNQFFNSNF
jgi:hypothetical protein